MNIQIDALTMLLQNQKKVQEILGNPMGTSEAALVQNTIALSAEVHEVLAELPWKPWHIQKKFIDYNLLKGEVADCFLFLFNIINEAGFSTSDIIEEIIEKQDNAIKRFGA